MHQLEFKTDFNISLSSRAASLRMSLECDEKSNGDNLNNDPLTWNWKEGNWILLLRRTWTGTPPSGASACGGRRRVPPSELKQTLSDRCETAPPVTHDGDGPGSPGSEDCGQNEGPEIGVDKSSPHDHAPENLAGNIFVTTEEMISYLWELIMSEGQSPETEVASGVRYGAQDILDRVDTFKPLQLTNQDTS